jgi:hypothetical protein
LFFMAENRRKSHALLLVARALRQLGP